MLEEQGLIKRVRSSLFTFCYQDREIENHLTPNDPDGLFERVSLFQKDST